MSEFAGIVCAGDAAPNPNLLENMAANQFQRRPFRMIFPEGLGCWVRIVPLEYTSRLVAIRLSTMVAGQ